jgi:hypothetical protein
VLNNPLSMTDPSGFFFGSIFHAIGNFVGVVFKTVASVFKAALRIPSIRAVIQIAACGSGVIALCVGVTGALAAAAGGGIGDVLKAMAFTVASYGVWGGVGGVLHGIESSFTTASVLVSSAVHGVVNGALSLAQGGSFTDGFVSGAIGQAAGMFAVNGPLGAIGGNGGATIRSIFAGAAGGAASELTGGKFMNGFVTAAFAQMWNGEGRGLGEPFSQDPIPVNSNKSLLAVGIEGVTLYESDYLHITKQHSGAIPRKGVWGPFFLAGSDNMRAYLGQAMVKSAVVILQGSGWSVITAFRFPIGFAYSGGRLTPTNIAQVWLQPDRTLGIWSIKSAYPVIRPSLSFQ